MYINFCLIFCKVLYIPYVFSKILRPVLCMYTTIVESQITRPFLCKSYNINVNISILRPSLLVHTILYTTWGPKTQRIVRGLGQYNVLHTFAITEWLKYWSCTNKE